MSAEGGNAARTIYLVTYEPDHANSWPCSVWSTREDAEAEAERLRSRHVGILYAGYDIFELVLDQAGEATLLDGRTS